MNKLLIVGAVGVVIIGGAFLVFSNQSGKGVAMQKVTVMQKSDATMEKEDSVMMEKSDETMNKDDSAMMKVGSYEAYSAEKISKATTGDVVLFFRASWCPTCRVADADIKANLKYIPSGLTILDVDYDTSSALKQKYGVTYQHTFVQVDREGNQIKKWSGSSTLAAIVAEVK